MKKQGRGLGPTRLMHVVESGMIQVRSIVAEAGQDNGGKQWLVLNSEKKNSGTAVKGFTAATGF